MVDEFDERADRRHAADRARRRAAEAGARITELRARLWSLRERQESGFEPPNTPDAVQQAVLRRDQAVQHDRAAHAAAARAHDSAAAMYERLSTEEHPEYARKARAHRAAAEKDREAGSSARPAFDARPPGTPFPHRPHRGGAP
jgi:hypothetical protein